MSGVIAVLLLLIAACNGSSAASTSRHVLTLGSATGVPQLNPITATFDYEQTMKSLLWDTLDRQEPNGSIGPDLATSWSPSADIRSWTYHLRHGVKFMSGRELTADDVVKTLAYFIDPKVPAQEAKFNSLITGSKAIDKYTVEIDLSAPDSAIPYTIDNVQILDMSALSSINQHPNVTGPFMVSQFVPDDHVNLVPNPNYWGPKPKLDEIDIVKVADPTAAITDLKTGSIQAFWGPPLTSIADLSSDSSIKLARPYAPYQLHELEFDDTSFPFNDVRARQAFSYAVDRATVLATAYAGIGVTSPENDYLSTKNIAYDANLPQYAFDLNIAKQLFDEVGVKTLTWWTIAGAYPEWVTEGQIIQADLAKIGIKMDIQTNEINTWVAKFYPAHKKYPGLVIPDVLDGGAAPQAFAFLYGNQNSLNWTDAGYDQAYLSALGTADSSQQASFYNQLQSIENQQVPSVVVLQSVRPVPYRSNISGVWVSNSGVVHLETASVS